jgi:hypothetical protein
MKMNRTNQVKVHCAGLMLLSLIFPGLAEQSSRPAQVFAVPEMEQRDPGPGHRVRVTAPEYQGTDVHHALYLPPDWKPGRTYPVIVEYSGNFFPAGGGSGEVADSSLGYGLSAGRFIWVVLPFINKDRTKNEVQWWGDEAATVEYCITTVHRICREWGGDPGRVFICGFSRGAIAVNYFGLYNDEVAALWRGLITHDHYDGVKEWNTPWGKPLDVYREKALERLKRIAGRPALVMQGESTKQTRDYLSGKERWADFAFIDARISKVFPELPYGLITHWHTDRWLLYDHATARKARSWVFDLAGMNLGETDVRNRIDD